ncbi:hypothetical protein DL93DRAFT_1462268 [Clavulina sp. PMI_390]|nr:hypothetical protein DL93DRAFT_1462268 [Clavulina sp. PMI_390]
MSPRRDKRMSSRFNPMPTKARSEDEEGDDDSDYSPPSEAGANTAKAAPKAKPSRRAATMQIDSDSDDEAAVIVPRGPPKATRPVASRDPDRPTSSSNPPEEISATVPGTRARLPRNSTLESPVADDNQSEPATDSEDEDAVAGMLLDDDSPMEQDTGAAASTARVVGRRIQSDDDDDDAQPPSRSAAFRASSPVKKIIGKRL